METATEFMYVLDRDNRFTYVNSSLARNLGYAAEELIGEPISRILTKEEVETNLARRVAEFIETGRLTLEDGWVAKDGRVLTCEVNAVAVHDAEGQYAGSRGVARDITERKRLEAQLEQQRLGALHADRLQTLGEMAAGIAHELNQPLNGIRTFAEAALYGMREGWEATRDETRDTFEEIVQQVDRITEIIDHMRVFARDSGPSETGSVRISDVVQGALKLVGAQLRVHGITTTVDVPEGLPGAAGQPNRFEEVLLNLIINARDAVEERRKREAAGWRGSLAIRAETDPDVKELRLSLSDNGGGIPEFVVDRIFDPFFTTKEVGRGTGLGLSIARGIVERYGGRLELQNRLGEGATFTIVLPIAEGAG